MKISIMRRLLAYLIDITIISLLVSVICSSLPEKNKSTFSDLNSYEIELMNGQITPIEYIEKYQNTLYDNTKANNIEITVNFILIIGYFVVFQYMNKGKTLGKMLLKIKVIDKKTKKPTNILKGLLRSILIFNVLSGLISAILINYLNKETYIIIYLTIVEIENILGIISFLFIIFRKDNRGLHDLISNTEVIEER